MCVHVLARLQDPAVADLMDEAMPVVVDRAIVEMREGVHLLEHRTPFGNHRAESYFERSFEMLYQGRVQIRERYMLPAERSFAGHEMAKALGMHAIDGGGIAFCLGLAHCLNQGLVAFECVGEALG